MSTSKTSALSARDPGMEQMVLLQKGAALFPVAPCLLAQGAGEEKGKKEGEENEG